MDSWIPQISDNIKRYIVLVLSAIGLVISIIIRLFIENTTSNLPGCKPTAFSGLFNCDSVINSVYGNIWGIPLSFLGAFYFICLLAIYGVRYENEYVIAIVSIVGILSVADFLYIEVVLVNHFCLYCTSIHIIVILIFILIGPPAIVNSYQDLKLKYQQRTN